MILTIYTALKLTHGKAISFHTDQTIAIRYSETIGIEITTISTVRKIFISQQIWKPLKKHVEKVVAVLTIQPVLKLIHGKA